jgi:hypothetical protein
MALDAIAGKRGATDYKTSTWRHDELTRSDIAKVSMFRTSEQEALRESGRRYKGEIEIQRMWRGLSWAHSVEVL